MNITSLIPTGMENKITSAELARLAGLKSVRELQHAIETERLAGAVICSSGENGGGYFLHETTTELRQHVKTVDSRAQNTLKSNAAARRALKELEQSENNN